jgi:hypothetical protein
MKNTDIQKISEVLSDVEMNQIEGGWRLFGWGAKHKNQTMVSLEGEAATGEYGRYYIFGIGGEWGFRQTDT